MSFCLIFTPDDPEIYTLNPSAWLILRLCSGRSENEIVAAYHAAVDPHLSRQEARREVRAGIKDLVEKRIIEVVNARRRNRASSSQLDRGYRREQKRPAAA
jgi:hypothetical protein